MKIGDQVRFLSEKGGGRIVGFQKGGIVLVEDADGFEIPMAQSDVVVVGNDDYDTGHMVQIKTQQKKVDVKTETVPEPTEKVVRSTFANHYDVVEERKGGDLLTAYLAFVPTNEKAVTQCDFDCYFINDCNYFLQMSYMVAEGNSWSLKAQMEVEPNTKEYIETVTREKLNTLGRVAIQLMAYKRGKSFVMKPVINIDLRLDPVKFFKLHTFRENNFFDEKALIYTIVENDKTPRPVVVDANLLKSEMYASQKEEPKKEKSFYEKPMKKRKGDEDVIVVDLHAEALLDTQAGMTAIDILNYQLDYFRRTLDKHKDKVGQRLIFIHGKGDGVLRRAIINELNYRFKKYNYQDASFQEYGYGATQVTIK